MVLDPSQIWGISAVQLPWNLLIGRSLVHYDKRLLAADLFSKIMDAILINLDDSGCFFSAYDALSGKGIGQKNALEGLVPIGFFLELVGIQFLNEREILIEGKYPFPWPLKISFRGRKIFRDQDITRIDFPGDKTRFIHGIRERNHPVKLIQFLELFNLVGLNF